MSTNKEFITIFAGCRTLVDRFEGGLEMPETITFCMDSPIGQKKDSCCGQKISRNTKVRSWSNESHESDEKGNESHESNERDGSHESSLHLQVQANLRKVELRMALIGSTIVRGRKRSCMTSHNGSERLRLAQMHVCVVMACMAF